MGLSASQGRFLTLTARKNNIEFQVQQLTQAKLQLAEQQDTEAYLWSNGMNIQHLYYSADGTGSISDDLPRLSYQICTASAQDGGLNMRVLDKYGRIVVSELPDPHRREKSAAHNLCAESHDEKRKPVHFRQGNPLESAMRSTVFWENSVSRTDDNRDVPRLPGLSFSPPD